MVFSEIHLKFLNRIGIQIILKTQLFSWKQITFHILENFIFFSALVFIGNRCLHNLSNLVAFIEGFSLLLTGILTTAKNLGFIVHKNTFSELNEEIKELSMKVKKDVLKLRIIKINEFVHFIVRLYYICVCITGIYFIFLPTYTFLLQKYFLKSDLKNLRRDVPMYSQ